MSKQEELPIDDVRERYRRLQKKVRGYRNEALRCREIARKLADARGTNAVLTGIYRDPHNKNGMLLFICAPNLDEGNLGEAAKIVMESFYGCAATKLKENSVKFGKLEIQGTEGDDR